MTALTQAPTDMNSSHRVVVRGPDGLELVTVGVVATATARLRSGSLDAALAEGSAPETSRLLAVRAAQLTSTSVRRRLATDWEALAARARHPQYPFDARVPIARGQVDDAADQILAVAELLRSSRPVSARGVAIARRLLTTASSPVYRVGRGGEDLAAAVARALAHL